jgi:quinol monooxygenase YgiN
MNEMSNSESGAVLLSARVVAQTSARRELLQALLEWAVAARRETGLRTSNVYEDVEAPAAFGLTAQWENSGALDAHIRSDPFGVLLGALELLAQSARVTVTRATGDDGTDALPTIRRLRETRGASRPVITKS